MTREFFVPVWLRARPAVYLVSHMAVMPLIDLYTSGLDWLAGGVAPPRALALFLGLTFLNGVVVEIGRKLRDPAHERHGVDTYTAAWGTRAAPAVWLAVLALTAPPPRSRCAPSTAPRPIPLIAALAAAAALPALLFLRTPRDGAGAQGRDGQRPLDDRHVPAARRGAALGRALA